jgi:hypothetical protein
MVNFLYFYQAMGHGGIAEFSDISEEKRLNGECRLIHVNYG